jgi:hypothetical protein
MIRVNEVKLATELAAYNIASQYDFCPDRFTEESKDGDEINYTEDAQKLYDNLYDHYYSIIMENMEYKEND